VQNVLEGHTDDVLSVAFSPDGRRIVSGSLDNSVRVWDSLTGEVQNILEGHTNSVWSVAFSPDGRRIVSGSLDNSVRVWVNDPALEVHKAGEAALSNLSEQGNIKFYDLSIVDVLVFEGQLSLPFHRSFLSSVTESPSRLFVLRVLIH